MLYGVAPPVLCLTTRSISLGPRSRIGVLRIAGGLCAGPFSSARLRPSPTMAEKFQVQQVRGLHVLLGEWLRGFVAMRVTGPWSGKE